jgi:hypothetical protein
VGRLFRGILAIKAALFGLLILVLWVRSYLVGDAFRKGNDTQYVEISSARGAVVTTFGHDGKKTKLEGSWAHVRAEEPETMLKESAFSGTPANTLGFGYSKNIIGDPPRGVVVNVMLPHWLAFLLAIPSALRWIWRWSQKPSVVSAGGKSWCPTCVNEIRGVVEKCPRCGGAVATEADMMC